MSNRILAGAVTLLLAASTLPAQITWGPALGLTMSKIGGADASTDQGTKMGLVAGVVVDKGTEGKPLFWRTGLAYSQQGSTEKDPTKIGRAHV